MEEPRGTAPRRSADKIEGADALTRRLAPPREGILVFTNGVFDLLHRGHVHALEVARGLGDALLVAVNSDASARRLGKGPDRPHTSEADRVALVAALECVDHVCLFDDDTPADLIEALLPDVLVKGGDYALDQVVGRDAVEANGGRVVLVPLIEGVSTSRILERMRRTETATN